ncbi:phosphatidylglycerophosphatase A family protein [Spirosoma fluviale]|uniref:Phosphatidylglycerophosphatase A n=1 Tax=Spirosoma fluviale TaxID=1597977 RepID=A0A286FBC0_9BACT|nr:phosphatidylglycerophosphatase A [Spirosoma fluviale]SOD80538.1 phosphatidylglycerophosphatase A [Spirosoma fluviale]
MHKLIATGLGIGYIRKGGGTVASIACCGVWYLVLLSGVWPGAAQPNAAQPGVAQPGGYWFLVPVLITSVITAVGIWSATVVEQEWGKDSYRVVVDELAGMCLTLLFIPITVKSLLAGLLLFRLFDIGKPLGIRKLEKLPGGWGVMLDDLLAGLYANILLRVALVLGIL